MIDTTFPSIKKTANDKKHRIYEAIQSIKDAILKVGRCWIRESLIRHVIMQQNITSKIKHRWVMRKLISFVGFLVKVLQKRWIWDWLHLPSLIFLWHSVIIQIFSTYAASFFTLSIFAYPHISWSYQ